MNKLQSERGCRKLLERRIKRSAETSEGRRRKGRREAAKKLMLSGEKDNCIRHTVLEERKGGTAGEIAQCDSNEGKMSFCTSEEEEEEGGK